MPSDASGSSSTSGRRRLLAVAFVDIVGYTTLSSTDEVAALELVELLQSLARESVDGTEGRIVKFLGDAVFLEFASAEAAVEASLRVPSAFEERVGSRDHRLRNGVHLGEATVADDGDVYGDVVNVAARIQSAAPPGEVVVSGDVWRQLRKRPTFDFGEPEEQSLKGLDEPVTTLTVRPRFLESSAPTEETAPGHGWHRRLAVLPFRLLRPDPDIDFLSFSLADAVACSLVGVTSLVVRAPASLLRWAADTPDPREVGREAEVELVLSGTILRAGDQVRVASQLTEVQRGTLLWNETATVSMGDLFQLQDDLANRIVESLAAPLEDDRDDEKDEPVRDRSHSGSAYELYLKANQRSIQEGDWAGGAKLYEAALDEDPEYAPAWARLGRCYRLIGKYSGDPDVTQHKLEQAQDALERALEVNPELAVAHSYTAQLEVERGRAIDGMARLLRRVSESGRAVGFYIGLTHACRYAGLVEASFRAHDLAVELDPQAVSSVPFTHLLVGAYEDAIAASEPHAFSVIHACIQLGRMDRARESLGVLRSRGTGGTMEDYTASLLAVTRGEVHDALELGWKSVGAFPDPEGRFQLTVHWAALGAVDDALKLLRRSVDGGYYSAPGLRRLEAFRGLRERTEFGAILEEAEAGRAAGLKAFRAQGGAPFWESSGSEPGGGQYSTTPTSV